MIESKFKGIYLLKYVKKEKTFSLFFRKLLVDKDREMSASACAIPLKCVPLLTSIIHSTNRI